ncbi:MAG: hypothetical protein Q9O24_01590 [Gammaproteobacteria bacterium]|nr:hypothetical protein [Gammaproteobacteria bacterium]
MDIPPGVPINQAPLANAGLDQLIEATSLNTVVTLDGSASNDPNGDPLSYSWTDALGNVVAKTASASVSLPLGLHVLTLTVETVAVKRHQPALR